MIEWTWEDPDGDLFPATGSVLPEKEQTVFFGGTEYIVDKVYWTVDLATNTSSIIVLLA